MSRWCETTGVDRGATMSTETAWNLGRLWYADRLSEDWAPKTIEGMESIFEQCGLTGAFWQLR